MAYCENMNILWFQIFLDILKAIITYNIFVIIVSAIMILFIRLSEKVT